MKLIRNIIVAFSLYSQIPMPIFKWEDDDMKHNLVFFPWVGAVIGGIIYGLMVAFSYIRLPIIAKLALLSLIPLIVTGGFHVDGFMDVQDALKSYKSKEEKLVILKDPSVGAFAIISLLKYALLWAASMSTILYSKQDRLIYIFAVSFFTCRAMTGITSLSFKHAKKDGMLNMETENVSRIDMVALIIELLIGCALMIYIEWLPGLLVSIGLLLCTFYYRHKAYKEFGGVTGDTSGFFLVIAEGLSLFILAVSSYIITM